MKAKQFVSAVLALISALFLFTSCETEQSMSVDQNRIYTEYELFYNANEDKTYARATFKFGNILGTKLELSDSSNVTFQGDILDWKPVLGFYEKDYAGFVQTGDFTFTNINGVAYTNTIEIHEIGYPASLDTISRSASFELFWTGDSLAPMENVTVVVNGENEADAQTFFQDDLAANSIIFPLNKLSLIGMGPGTIFMDRRFVPALTQATDAGGLITGRYRPGNAAVYLE
jgi:hypothetical protein